MRCRKFIYTILHIYIFHAKWWLQAICLSWHLHVFMCVTLLTRVPLTAFQSLEILWVVGWNKQWLIGWLNILYYLSQEKAWDPLHWADDILGSGCEQPFILKSHLQSRDLQPIHLCIFVTGILSELVLVNLENAKILCRRTSTSHWPVHCRDQQTISDEHNQNISNHISDHHWLPIKTGCDKYCFIRWARNHRRWEALAS